MSGFFFSLKTNSVHTLTLTVVISRNCADLNDSEFISFNNIDENRHNLIIQITLICVGLKFVDRRCSKFSFELSEKGKPFASCRSFLSPWVFFDVIINYFDLPTSLKCSPASYQCLYRKSSWAFSTKNSSTNLFHVMAIPASSTTKPFLRPQIIYLILLHLFQRN